MHSVGFADRRGVETAGAHSHQFQPEIQGLRAISVLGVVCAHAGLPGLPGGFTGVDVFFVISGFLITRLLLAEVERTGRIDLLAFWARRARRLLPNAYATLIGTLLLALFLFRGYTPKNLVSDITFAALEIVNFRFAEKAIDYFQMEGAASPVLHFWSLSVEEQFYILWPLLLAGMCLVWRGLSRGRVIVVLGLIWCVSFAASVILTFHEQPTAYFSTGTRCWQLATGALLAAGWPQVERLPRLLRARLAWLGLAVILLSMAIIDEGAFYPGAWALLPTLGAAALIAGFEAADPGGPLRRGLSLPLMQWVGARSYSWYLWHWPLLALPRETFPDSPYIVVLAIPASLVIASFTYAWIELPLRSSRTLAGAPFKTFAAAAAGLVLIFAAGRSYLPALHLLDPQVATRVAQIGIASRDISQASKEGCSIAGNEVKQPLCLYGDPMGRHRVVLFGDSHADHWFSAFDAGAKQAGWQLLVWTKPSCPPAAVTPFRDKKGFTACDQWREGVLRRLTKTELPDLVVLSSYANHNNMHLYNGATGRPFGAAESVEAWRDGFRQTLWRLIDAGVKVVVIRDVPRPDKEFKSCLLTGARCIASRAQALVSAPADAEVAKEFGDRVTLLDLTDIICDASACPATRDGLIVYRDDHHITASYAATFAPQMAALLRGFAPTAALPSIPAQSPRKEASSSGLDGSSR